MILMAEGIIIGFFIALPLGMFIGGYLSRLGFQRELDRHKK
jgi:uncharacterized protein YneF (UPF0154 family)